MLRDKNYKIRTVLVFLLLVAMAAGWQGDPEHPCFRGDIDWQELPQAYWTTRHGDQIRVLDSEIGIDFLLCSFIPYWLAVYDYRDLAAISRRWTPKSRIEQAAEMLKEKMNQEIL